MIFGGAVIVSFLAMFIIGLSLDLKDFSEEFNKAFEGMQPVFKQVPPSVGFFSTQATFIPNWDALIAATYPPGPAPIIIRS